MTAVTRLWRAPHRRHKQWARALILASTARRTSLPQQHGRRILPFGGTIYSLRVYVSCTQSDNINGNRSVVPSLAHTAASFIFILRIDTMFFLQLVDQLHVLLLCIRRRGLCVGLLAPGFAHLFGLSYTDASVHVPLCHRSSCCVACCRADASSLGVSRT